MSTIRQTARVSLLAALISYAALLRFDAISHRFDPVSAPRWLAALQRARQGDSVLRPASMRWTRTPQFPHRDGPPTQYRSDPYTYLERARQMHGFYSAHLREPLFPFTTKIALWLLDNQDVAVSVASAAFSVVAVAGTFALGAMTLSYRVGLAAAFLLAIDYDVITFAAGGWRDDAFTASVVWCCVAALAFVRRPSLQRAVLLGCVAAAACLVRITSISFLVPAWLWIAFSSAPVRARRRYLSAATTVAAALVAPYLVACWRAYGDPWYAINTHAVVYQVIEDPTEAMPTSTVRYLQRHASEHPWATLDTVAMGLTAYPFSNKWVGLDRWSPVVGRVLAPASLLGLVVFVATSAGRLILLVLGSSLLPFAVTWKLLPEWRFTEHAYPFLLLAACVFIAMVLDVARHPRRVLAAISPRHVAVAVGGLVALLVVTIMLTQVTPSLVFTEHLKAGEPATILAGDRDGAFFSSRQWPQIVRSSNVATRVASGTRASMQIPLSVGCAYEAIVRIDPATAPVTSGEVSPIQILLNGRFLTTCHSQSSPERIGTCDIQIPADAVNDRMNRLTFVSERASGFRVWYVRVRRW